jgi:hypothetical protein
MRSRRLRIGLVAVLALLALGLTACGRKTGSGIATASGGKNNKATPSASPQPGDREEQMRKFAACMRDHGVDVEIAAPGKNSDEGGVTVHSAGPQDRGGQGDVRPDSDTFKKAEEACRSLAPNGGDLPKPSAAELEQLRKFAACMRSHGIDVPDPDPDGGGIQIRRSGDPGGGGDPGNLSPDDPAFKAAEEACRNLLPSGRPMQPGGGK